MQSTRLLTGLLALPLLVVGCSSGDDGDVETAAQAWRAVNVASQPGQQEFQAAVELGTEGELKVNCPEGGSLTLDGRLSDQHDFSFNLAFDGCGANDVIIDGVLSMSASVRVSDSSAEIRFDYVGQLELSGAIEATCDIDATGRVAAETSASGSSAEVSFSGRICGASANAVVKASS
jgi:hypothetical protein